MDFLTVRIPAQAAPAAEVAADAITIHAAVETAAETTIIIPVAADAATETTITTPAAAGMAAETTITTPAAAGVAAETTITIPAAAVEDTDLILVLRHARRAAVQGLPDLWDQ